MFFAVLPNIQLCYRHRCTLIVEQFIARSVVYRYW